MGKKNSASCIVSVCTGGSCSDHKSKKSLARLKALVKERGLKARVTVRKTDCRKRCDKGPIVCVCHPGMTFEGVKPKKAEGVLDRVAAKLGV